MAEKCGAKNRQGNPCGRSRSKGRKRCNLHGGRSTGAKTVEGKIAAIEARVQHGAYAELGVYERMLAGARPDLWAQIPTDTSLERELRFARMRLAELAETAPEGAREALLNQVRLLSLAQHELRPGGDASGELKVTVTIAEASAPTPEAAPC